MPMSERYEEVEPARTTIDALPGGTIVEFGAPWCGYCQAAQPLIETAFKNRTDIRHIKIEDGSGRALGRSFRVKLWPTLIYLHNGEEVARVVRPTSIGEIESAIAQLENS